VRRAPAPSGNPLPGTFIVLEGIDGSGKTEQTRRLASWLRARGEDVVETCEPTESEWGRRYRAWARNELEAEPVEVLGFFLEDRRQHVSELIRPALEAGRCVVCDRYAASTLAYQAAQGIPAELLRKRLEQEDFPEPDLTLWLRLPVAQALARLERASGERFEHAAFLERVDAAYARLGLEMLDGSGSIHEVARAIQERVRALLGD
jgi:dTMP kinase